MRPAVTVRESVSLRSVDRESRGTVVVVAKSDRFDAGFAGLSGVDSSKRANMAPKGPSQGS